MGYMKNNRRRRRESNEPRPEWTPKSEIGRMVKSGQITSIEEIFQSGKKVLEHEIVDFLYPNAEDETIEVKSTQRMTDNGRKAQFRAVVLVGDRNGHVGLGAGKCEEVKPAIESAIKNAKRNMIAVPFGCGSWETSPGFKNSIPVCVSGRAGSVRITLKPAPRGVGLAANSVVKKVLSKAGVKDIWSFSTGRTRNIYNTALATIDALEKLNSMRLLKGWDAGDRKESS